tara:strand:+ start:2103 stop:2321 length:219 start_codon:yes stop_codon:yes gene_type:complete
MLNKKGDNMKEFLNWLVSDNPTPQQIKNRIILRRKWRKIKKALKPDDIIFPMMLGIIALSLVGYLAIKLGGV